MTCSLNAALNSLNLSTNDIRDSLHILGFDPSDGVTSGLKGAVLVSGKGAVSTEFDPLDDVAVVGSVGPEFEFTNEEPVGVAVGEGELAPTEDDTGGADTPPPLPPSLR